MNRLPRRIWRWIHLSSFALFLLASLHAAFAGTDRSDWLYQATAAASIVAVMWAMVYRLTHRKRLVTQRVGSRTTNGVTRA